MTVENESFVQYTKNENDVINKVSKYSLPSIPTCILWYVLLV